MADGTRSIPLTRGLAALVDGDDYEALSQFRWYAQPGANTFYAARRGPRDESGKRLTIVMHRLILAMPPWQRGGPEVDHMNRDGLDNRKANLRAVTHQENALNRRNSRLPRACETCSQSYMPSHPTARFCSSSCARRRSDHPRSRRTLLPIVCPGCGLTFQPANHRTRCCSKGCSNTARSRKIGMR